MAGRLRRRLRSTEHTGDEGPFVSFTDLFIGILFLFLILVAVLMLMHQEAVQRDAAEMQRMSGQIQQISGQSQQMQAKIDAAAKLDADHPPFRLAIVYNAYQRAAGAKTDWIFSRTVQVFRAPNDLCLDNVILRNNLNLAWKRPVKAETIPTSDNKNFIRMGAPCTLSASGEHWNLDSETGGVERVSANLYAGASVLHKNGGEETVEIQYRVLGIYDDYFRKSKGGPKSLRLNRS